MRRPWLPLAIVVSAAAVSPRHARADDAPAEVHVSGERGTLRRSAKDETPSSTVLSGDALRAPGASLGDALRPVAGVVLSSAGSASDLATVSIRGATSAQLPVYLAGVRLNDDLTGTFDASTVPTWMLDRVELFRGNAPPSADRLGLAGALFLEPRRPRGPLAMASSTVGTFGAREASGLVAVGDGESSALFAIRHGTATNDYPYTQDRGTLGTPADDVRARRRNADATTTDAWSTGRARLGRFVINTLVHAFHREQGAPGQLLVPALRARLLTTRGLFDVSLRAPCGERCTALFGLGALRSSTDVRDPLREIGLGSTAVHTTGERIVPRVRIELGAREDLAAQLGVDLGHESLVRTTASRDGLAGKTSDTKARRLSAHGSAQTVWDASPRVRLSLLGALDATETAEADGPAVSQTPGSARLGVRFGDEAFAVLANVGRAVRLPTLGELFGQSAVLGGNPALLPERAWALDLGVRAKRPLHRALLFETQVFGFGRLTDDLVVYQRDSFLVFRPRNLRSARTLGGEGSFALGAFRVVRAEQALTFLDARDTSDGPNVFTGQLPFLPRLVSSSRLTIIPWSPSDRHEGSLSGTLVRQGARFADGSGLVVIPSQTTLDLSAKLRLPAGRHLGATLAARADNVTNARRVDVVGYPLPPRQVFVSLELAAQPSP